MTTKKEHKENDSKFGIALFHALRAYGYLFPANTESVERFDALYGNTAIDIPINIKIQHDKSNNLRVNDIDLNLFSGIAAFSSHQNNSNFLDLNNDSEEAGNND